MNKRKLNTVPNQKIFHIHRESTGKNFIAINKINFSKAYRDMSKTPAALGLYIWLVGNQNGYHFAFSPQAIENQLGMAQTSCRDAVKRLTDLGYLVNRENSKIVDFYEVSTKEKELDRKKVESDMILFENPTDPVETSYPFPKPGEFTF